MKFRKGESGNPAGRKPGRMWSSRKQIADWLPKAIELVKQRAAEGDNQCLLWLASRAVGPAKARGEPVKFDLPDGATLAERGEWILKAAAGGKLTPDEAAALLSALASQAKLIETTDLLPRLKALEGNRR